VASPIPPNILVQSTRDVQGILDRLGITTQSQFELIPAVLPTIAFERPTPSAEKLAWGRVSIGPLAANNSHCSLFNPAGSGVLIHVDSAIVSSSAGTEFQGGQFDTALTTNSSAKNFRDRRVPGTPVGQPRAQNNATLLATGEMLSASTEAREPFLLPIDAYIQEGQGIFVACISQNIACRTGWFWEELPPAEL